MVAFFVVMCALAVAVVGCLVYLAWALLTSAVGYLYSACRTRGRAERLPAGAVGAESASP